jgi:hypothetical protein
MLSSRYYFEEGTMFKKICVAVMFVVCSVSTAFAGIDGTYTLKQGQALKAFKVKTINGKTVQFSALVTDGVNGGCGGTVPTTKAHLAGNVATFKGDGNFVLKMTFADGKLVVVEEGNGTKYHGAKCNYAGTYAPKAVKAQKGAAPKKP